MGQNGRKGFDKGSLLYFISNKIKRVRPRRIKHQTVIMTKKPPKIVSIVSKLSQEDADELYDICDTLDMSYSKFVTQMVIAGIRMIKDEVPAVHPNIRANRISLQIKENPTGFAREVGDDTISWDLVHPSAGGREKKG